MLDPTRNLILLLFIAEISAISFNQPKFCPNASWNPNAITFATNATIGTRPTNIFINVNNTIFLTHGTSGSVVIWANGSTTPTALISANLSSPGNLFVTSNDEIFVYNSCPSGRVDGWALNQTRLSSSMFTSSQCWGLFIDINNNLYCSQVNADQVISQSLNSPPNMMTIIAGTGCSGSSSNMLDSPRGIFVTSNLDLYVADCYNNRVQMFRAGQSNASTVAGNGAPGTITLYNPMAVTLDGDGYLFIVDNSNHRIVGEGPYGFRCLVGCNGSGTAANQLYYPSGFSFDNMGNIFVADSNNNRIQKFMLTTGLCDPPTVAPTSTQLPIEQSTDTQQTTMITTSSTTLINQSCFPPQVSLIPGTSLLSSPIQVPRYQDFYLSSSIQLDCNDSLMINMQWTINNCPASCLNAISLGSTVITTFSELYIPARSLPIGIYQMRLTVTMNVLSKLSSSASAYVRITRSGIKANLVQLGTSMITSGHQQDLPLNPGLYSVDLDGNDFNARDWDHTYYCRICGLWNFLNLAGVPLSIDDAHLDPLNRSCTSNQPGHGSAWRYDGVSLPLSHH